MLRILEKMKTVGGALFKRPKKEHLPEQRVLPAVHEFYRQLRQAGFVEHKLTEQQLRVIVDDCLNITVKRDVQPIAGLLGRVFQVPGMDERTRLVVCTSGAKHLRDVVVVLEDTSGWLPFYDVASLEECARKHPTADFVTKLMPGLNGQRIIELATPVKKAERPVRVRHDIPAEQGSIMAAAGD